MRNFGVQGLKNVMDKSIKDKLKKLVSEKIANPKGQGELEIKKKLNDLPLTHCVIPTCMDEVVSYKQKNQPSNKYSSTRGNCFVPMAFLYQLKKVVNIFYIMNFILQMQPSLQTNSPYASLVGVIVMILIGMCKEFYVEVQRMRKDKAVNSFMIKRMKKFSVDTEEPTFEEVNIVDIKVGDILEIENDGFVPADCILLKTEDPHKHSAYFSTASLEGENYLKKKQTIKCVRDKFSQIFCEKSTQKLKIESTSPVVALNSFRGKVTVKSKIRAGKDDLETQDLKNINFIARGSTNMSLHKIYLIVIHTGSDTKITMNLGRSNRQFKRSTLESGINKIFAFNFIVIVLVSGISTLFSRHFMTHKDDYDDLESKQTFEEAQYLFEDAVSVNDLQIRVFFSFYLILNSMIPIELIIGFELSKIFQTYIMENDAFIGAMYRDGQKFKGIQCQSLNLHEELGMVDQVFADKTGTLTTNELKFKSLSIANQGNLAKIGQGSVAIECELEEIHEKLTSRMEKQRSQDCKFQVMAERFFECIALCNSSMPPTDDQDSYEGPSEDENISQKMAKKINTQGFMCQRDSDTISIKYPSGIKSFKIVRVFDYTAHRKSMTVIVKSPDSDRLIAFSKGADSAMMEMTKDKDGLTTNDVFVVKKFERDIKKFQRQGLRTLVYGFRELPIEESDVISGETQLTYSRVEHSMTLLGITGFEDIIQAEAKRTVLDFQEANIKVWMLTGDAEATAREIAFQTGVFAVKEKRETNKKTDKLQKNRITPPAKSDHMTIYEIDNDKTFKATENDLMNVLAKSKQIDEFQLLISGTAIEYILRPEYKRIHEEFFTFLRLCHGVVIYRANPDQKARVVEFFINNSQTKGKTLAIGDGINDVAMIQKSHIGIVLHGKKENLAASFADYVTPQFQDLRRLLFWHGRSFNQKITSFTLWTFFQAAVFGMSVWYYNEENGYSGFQPIDDYIWAMNSVLMNTIALFSYSFFENFVSFTRYGTSIDSENDMGFKLSHLYSHCRDQAHIFRFKYFVYFVYAWFCMYVQQTVYFKSMEENYGMASQNGKTLDSFSYGVFLVFVVTLVTHGIIYYQMRNWSLAYCVVFATSLFISLFFVTRMQDLQPSAEIYMGIYSFIFHQFYFWLLVGLSVATCTVPLYAYTRCYELFYEPQFYCETC